MLKKFSAVALAMFMLFALASQVFAADFNLVNTTPNTTDNIVRTDGTNLGTNDVGPPNTNNFMNSNTGVRNGTGTNGFRVRDGIDTNRDGFDTSGINGVRDSNRYGTRGMMGNNLRTRATTTTTNNTNWGWLGILGLIGLAGMAGRNRATDRDR